MNFKAKIMSSNGLILALMIVLTSIVFISVRSLISNFTWVSHTYKVLAVASSIEAAAVDMETGMRGYLLAGKPDFLEPYNNGEEHFIKLTNELKSTVSDNPAQVQLLEDISKTIDKWKYDITEPAIALRHKIVEAKSMNDIAKVIQKAEGKKYFDKFRSQITTFIDREKVLLEKRKEQTKKSYDINELRELSAWVDHTHVVIEMAQSIVVSSINMETGMRGFLLAGKDEFLEPYQLRFLITLHKFVY